MASRSRNNRPPQSITNNGTRWELLNSIWILWALCSVGLFNYISLYYIAIRTRQRKWFIWGLVYTIPALLYFLYRSDPATGQATKELLSNMLLISWIVSSIHVIRARPEYLIRLEFSRGYDRIRSAISQEYQKSAHAERNAKQAAKKAARIAAKTAKASKGGRIITAPDVLLDINQASESELALISPIGALLASKIIELRSERKFSSLDDLIMRMKFKPHVFERIRPFVTCSNEHEAPVDIHNERILDY